MNVQYAIKDGVIYVLEVNPRASRTVPFVAKTIGRPDRQDRGAHHGRREPRRRLRPLRQEDATALKHIAVKEAVFPFARFPGVDILLGPEMKSTGEVMGLDTRFRAGLRQERSSAPASTCRAPARCSSRCATRTRRACCPPSSVWPSSASRCWRQAARALPRRKRHRGRKDQQGSGRPPAYRGRHPQPSGPARVQHHRRPEGGVGLKIAAPRHADAEGALLHDAWPAPPPPPRRLRR
jgi:hypothetical protein